MKKVFFLTLIMVLPLFSYAQSLHRNQFGGAPRIRTSSFGLWYVLQNVEGAILSGFGVDEMSRDDYAEFYKKNSWVIPETSFAIHVPQSLKMAGESIKTHSPYWWRELLYGDYSHNFNLSFGYELSWKSLIYPIGGYVAVNWEYKQLDVTSEGLFYGKHRSQSVVPEAGLRFRLFGSGFDKDINYNPTLELGAAYVCPFKYHGPNDYDKQVLNKGFRIHGSIGLERPSAHTTWLLQYDYDLFNYFNQDFTPDNDITFPFKDVKNNFGILSIKVSHSF